MGKRVIKQLLQCVAIVTVGTLAIILFIFVIWNESKGTEPITDEQVAKQMQRDFVTEWENTEVRR